MSARLIMRLDVVAAERRGDVALVTFRHPRRPALPPATAGAHVDLHLPDKRIRQYSLCGDPADSSVYRVAIKREDQGRGGSRWIHETLKPGDTLPVSAPRNHFPLEPEARHHILVGGGIGVTPLLAMAHDLTRRQASFDLHYCARDTALLHELRAVCGDRLSHYPGSGKRFDPACLTDPRPDVHVYACGPASLMDAIAQATAAWPEDHVHMEAFRPLVDENFVPEPFEIELAATGQVLRVPADRSALEVLRSHGFDLPSSCEIGVCGSCECVLLAGSAIHRDVVLSPGKRKHRFIPCVSRAHGRIVLDPRT